MGGTNTTYLYDANGSLTKKDDGTNVHAYKHDFRNLMTDYDGPGTNNDTTYRYDALGRRITKNVNGTKTAYLYDFWNVVADYNGSNQLQATYLTPGLDDNLSMTRSGSTYYYLQDGLGSVRQLLGSDETTENAYDYEAFGETYGTPTESVTNRYRFTGREWDSESTIYYYRSRHLNGTFGRFLQRDPLAPFLPLGPYGYVGLNPLNYIDPWGEHEKDVHQWLTQYLAAAAGFSKKECCCPEEIGKANQAMDEGWTRPELPGTDKYHFPTDEEVKQYLDDAKKSCKASDIGKALHALQDSYSHQPGMTDKTEPASGNKGWHIKKGHWPDKTYNRPELADRMARDTYEKLKELAAACKCKTPPRDWSELDKAVQDFNRAHDEAEKNRTLGFK